MPFGKAFRCNNVAAGRCRNYARPGKIRMTYKLTLEYDGSKFSGWQVQINARTVQGELQRVADELFGVAVDVQGAGRTDAGVHALGQVAHIKVRDARKKYTPSHLMTELNEKLPSSIAVVECRSEEHTSELQSLR